MNVSADNFEESKANSSFFGRHDFLIRRLHSLSGLIPVGAYMVIHLLTNASILNGVSTFQRNVNTIHSLGRILPLVEWTFIFIPLLFHAIIGVLIIRSGVSNTSHYPYTNNYRYTLQRVSGVVALLFILWHVFHMHGWFHFEFWRQYVVTPLGGGRFWPFNAASSAAAALQSPLMSAWYVVGVLASVFHLANGIWTMGITWGVWVSPAAQHRASLACGVFGVGLAVVGVSAIGGFWQVDVHSAWQQEQKIYQQNVQAGWIEPDEHKRMPPPTEGVR